MSNILSTILIYGVLIGGMYFLMFRPQQKKRKQEEEMRNSLEIGDEIITIGGIIGKIVSIKNDSETIVIESGSDKIRIKTWAVSSVVSDKVQNNNAK